MSREIYLDLMERVLGAYSSEHIDSYTRDTERDGIREHGFARLTANIGILLAHGWTALTALCVMLFSLLHFPCSTTCLTIYHETRSLRWMALAALLPTLCGMALCMTVTAAARLFGLV